MAILTRIRKLIGALIQWVWAHKLKTGAYALFLLIGVYGTLFALVSCSSSPTTETISVQQGRTLAFSQVGTKNGQGPRAILLHGAPADANSWNQLLKQKNEIHASEILVVDRIGYGNSTNEDELTLAGHAESIEPLLEPVNGHKPVIVGHSYGDPVALRIAADYPEQVGGIVLVAGACDAYMQDAQWFRKGVDGINAIVPEPWERANRELLALTAENQKMEPLLDRVTCRVVVVHGTWDGVCPHDSTVAYLRSRLTHAEKVKVISLERAGHNLQLSHVEEVVSAINHVTDNKD